MQTEDSLSLSPFNWLLNTITITNRWFYDDLQVITQPAPLFLLLPLLCFIEYLPDLSYYIRGVFVDVWSPISIFGSLLAFIGTHTASPTKTVTSLSQYLR